MNLNDSYKLIAKTIHQHLDLNKTKAFIFGSRATNKYQKFSDIDIGILSDDFLPLETISIIKEEIEESDIPYLVDIVDFKHTSQKFKQVALKNTINLKKFLYD